MYLAIPASTSDDERVFSSAGFILNQRRTRLDLDNFRRENRVRQYITLGNSVNSLSGRNARMEAIRPLVELLQAEIARRAAQPPQ